MYTRFLTCNYTEIYKLAENLFLFKLKQNVENWKIRF